MSATRISDDGRELIEQREAVRLTVYRDSAGYLTAGMGHKLDANTTLKEGDIITQGQSDAWAQSDIEHDEYAVNVLVKVPLNQNQYDALCSLVHNIGWDALRDSTLLKLLNASDYTGAQEQFIAWHYVTVDGKKVPSQGLLNRRIAEAAQFGSPVSAAETSAQTTVPPAVAPTPPPNHVAQTTTGKLQLTALATGGAAAVIQGVQQAQPVINAAQNAVSLTAGLPQWLRLLSVACVVGCIACAGFTLYHKHKDFKPEDKT